MAEIETWVDENGTNHWRLGAARFNDRVKIHVETLYVNPFSKQPETALYSCLYLHVDGGRAIAGSDVFTDIGDAIQWLANNSSPKVYLGGS